MTRGRTQNEAAPESRVQKIFISSFNNLISTVFFFFFFTTGPHRRLNGKRFSMFRFKGGFVESFQKL